MHHRRDQLDLIGMRQDERRQDPVDAGQIAQVPLACHTNTHCQIASGNDESPSGRPALDDSSPIRWHRPLNVADSPYRRCAMVAQSSTSASDLASNAVAILVADHGC